MYDSTRTVAVALALLTVVGFGIAPMTAVASPSASSNAASQPSTAPVAQPSTAYQLDGTGLSTQANQSGPFPQAICTDLLGMIHEQAPYDMIVWVDDLPESVPRDIPNKDQLPEPLRPPGIPWSVVTPRAVGGIIVGATPNHCDVFNPNDPPYDPVNDGEDNFAPDGGGDVQQGENGKVLFIVNGTLDNTSQGPSMEGTAGLDLAQNGTLDPSATLNDGEKDYGVDPQLKYWSDGTTYFDTDVFVFGTRLGTVMDCTGPECTFSTRGLPNFADYPSLPSHTDSDPDAGSGSSGDSGSGADDGNGTDDGTGGTGTGGDSTDGTAGGGGSGGGADGTNSTNDGTAGAGTGGSGGSGGSGSGSGSGGSGSSDGGQAGSGGSGGSGGQSGAGGQSGTGGQSGDGGQSGGDSNSQQQAQGENGGNQGAQQAAAADGSGLGVVIAMVVFILGAAAIAPRD